VILSWTEASRRDGRSVKHLRAVCKEAERRGWCRLYYGGRSRRYATGIPEAQWNRLVVLWTQAPLSATKNGM